MLKEANKIAGNKSNYFVDIVNSNNNQTIFATGNFSDTLIFSADTIINPISQSSSTLIYSTFIFAIKSNGNLLWNKVLYGKNVKASSIAFYNNKIYSTGSYVDTLFVDNDTLSTPAFGAGLSLNESIFLICLDTSGNLIFVKDYGYSKGYYPEALAVNDSGIYISGIFKEFLYFNNDTIVPNAFPDMFFTKTDLNGNRQWTKTANYYLSKRYEKESQLIFDDNYNIYITGHYNGSFNYLNDTITGSNTFILKSDFNGNLISLYNFSISDSIEIKDAKYINGNIYYSATALSNAIIGEDTITVVPGLSKAFLTKMDSSLIFKKTISANLSTKGKALSIDKSNNIYWSIRFDSLLIILNDSIENTVFPFPINNAIIKITADSIIRYTHIISGNDFIVYTSDVDSYGNYYIAGYISDFQYYDTSQFTLNGINDGFLAKISCKPPKPFIFSNDTTICWNEQKNIWVNSNNYLTPLWQNASNDTLIIINQGGLFFCQFVDENSCKSDTTFINIYQFPKTNVNILQSCDTLFVDFPQKGEWWFNDTLINSNNQVIAQENGWYFYNNIDTNGCFIVDSIYFNKQRYTLKIESKCDSLYSGGINKIVTWYRNNISVDTGYYYIVSEDGKYYYTLVDSTGCSWNSDTVEINVSKFSELIDFFPNPAGEMLHIKGLSNGIIKIFNITSKLEETLSFDNDNKKETKRCKISNNFLKIDLSQLPAGTHIIQIQSGNTVFSKKIIKN